MAIKKELETVSGGLKKAAEITKSERVKSYLSEAITAIAAARYKIGVDENTLEKIQEFARGVCFVTSSNTAIECARRMATRIEELESETSEHLNTIHDRERTIEELRRTIVDLAIVVSENRAKDEGGTAIDGCNPY